MGVSRPPLRGCGRRCHGTPHSLYCVVAAGHSMRRGWLLGVRMPFLRWGSWGSLSMPWRQRAGATDARAGSYGLRRRLLRSKSCSPLQRSRPEKIHTATAVRSLPPQTQTQAPVAQTAAVRMPSALPLQGQKPCPVPFRRQKECTVPHHHHQVRRPSGDHL